MPTSSPGQPAPDHPADLESRAELAGLVSPERCIRGDAALARAFSVLGKRWTGVVLGNLSTGPTGFRELSRAMGGVSDSVLSDRLSELTRSGLVARTVDPGPPVTVSYELTARGQALIPALTQISRWAEEHLPTESG